MPVKLCLVSTVAISGSIGVKSWKTYLYSDIVTRFRLMVKRYLLIADFSSDFNFSVSCDFSSGLSIFSSSVHI